LALHFVIRLGGKVVGHVETAQFGDVVVAGGHWGVSLGFIAAPSSPLRAWPRILKKAWESGFSAVFHSGCHCTASTGASLTLADTASTTPSGAWASTVSPSPSRPAPWKCTELTR